MTINAIPILTAASLACGILSCKQETPTSHAEGWAAAAKQGDKTMPIEQPVHLSAPTTDDPAPSEFTVKFETTQGDLIIDVHREWAPHGADRFYTLVKSGFYNGVAFFRVLDGFMAQTGLNGDPAVTKRWRDRKIPDDPVTQSNQRGTASFATSGPNSRTTQFFINYGNNSKLDSMGFAPFGKVRDMQAIDRLYSGYGEGYPKGNGPNQGLIRQQGNSYLKESFPKLDYIKTARIEG